MKTIIRLNESELHGMVKEIASKLIKEMDERSVLSTVAASITALGHVRAKDGENMVELELPNGEDAIVFYEVFDMSRGVGEDNLIEDYDIVVNAISLDGGEIEINDSDAIVQNALEEVVEVEHDVESYDYNDDYDEDDSIYYRDENNY